MTTDLRIAFLPLTDAAVMPVLVYSNARRTGPGEVTVTPTGRGIVVPDDDSGRTAAALFAGSGLEVEVVADFVTALWQKLLVNVMANPLTALTGRTTGELFEQPAMAALGLDLALETVAVARAEGPRSASTTPGRRWPGSLPSAAPGRRCSRTAPPAEPWSTRACSARWWHSASTTVCPRR